MRNSKIEYEEALKNERPFSANDWASDIRLLFEEFLVGDFELEESKIVCKFMNGQKFNVTVEEVIE